MPEPHTYEYAYTEPQPVERPKLLLPAILFVTTMLTTTAAGALYKGLNVFKYPHLMVHGISFSASLLIILGTHELGHFLASRRHGVSTTLPLFIPGPPIPPMIGTFGAVIRIKSPITSKKALVDIGAAGPLSGFVVALIVTAIGLKYSTLVPVAHSAGGLGLGSSISFHILSYLILGPMPQGYDVILHPIAFAGWIGFFVTAMNLLPIGQLDGGHIIYALIGPRHRLFSMLMIAVIVILGLLTWPGWLIWAILITIIALRHPPVEDQHVPMDRRRKLTSIFAMAVFILTFIPTPFYIIGV